MSFEAAYTNRRTRDILEDYDLSLYALSTDGTTALSRATSTQPESLWLGLDYFGYAENPGSNFVIATLAGGKRDYHGARPDLPQALQQQLAGAACPTPTTGQAATPTRTRTPTSRATYLWLDPRAPNAYATQPGTIPHVFKAAGSYIIADRRASSARATAGTPGASPSQTCSDTGRNLPIQVGR